MKKLNLRVLAALAATMSVVLAASHAQASIITKSPDLGDFWYPLNPVGGSYVYADSFVAPANSTVASLGTWINTQNFDPSTAVTFQVWGSVGNDAVNGPNSASILATTAGITGMNGGLTFYSGATPGSLTLTSGDTYWFVATVVGASGTGQYQVGGHTQNSGGINDNGTFWYSNDPSGQNFDGRGLTPEMAFQVELTPTAVPEPSTYIAGALLLLPFGFQALRRLLNHKLVS